MTLPDVDTFVTTYGGVKSDAQAPVLNPFTDRSAAGADSALLTIAALTHTVPRAYVTISLGTSPAVLSTRGTYDAVWGTNYVPSVTRLGTGHSRITFPSTTVDAEGKSHATNIRWARATPGLGVPFAQTVLAGPNVIEVWYGNQAGIEINDFTSAYTIRAEIG